MADAGQPFRYLVFFGFKPETPDTIREAFVARWTAFIADCPEARQPELNAQHSAGALGWGERDYDFLATMVFESQADFEAYVAHPLHRALHTELISPHARMDEVMVGKFTYGPLGQP